MNTVSTRPGHTEQQHPPSSPTIVGAPRRANRVALIDRVALRIGVALVAWSRRPRVLDHRDRQQRRLHTTRATEQRERAMQRAALLTLPSR